MEYICKNIRLYVKYGSEESFDKNVILRSNLSGNISITTFAEDLGDIEPPCV